jgi:hypothetical protein
MADPTSAEITADLIDGFILTKWWFYLVWLLVTAIGSGLGVWLQEKLKGDISKNIWLAQESWKEKYRLYTAHIEATEEIACALWSIVTDVRVLAQMPMNQPSFEQDGLRLFPEHQEYLDCEAKAIEKIAAASVGVELMLNKKAQQALEKIRTSRTRSLSLANLSYRQRIEERQTAASEAKAMFIEAAKEDLKI